MLAFHATLFVRVGAAGLGRENESGRREKVMSIFDFLFERCAKHFDGHGMLYHYTSFDTLQRFVEDDGDFYCTNALALNDDSELIQGLSIAKNYLQKHFCWTEECLNWFEIAYRKLIVDGGVVLPWVMSFSRDGDSLTQWGMYTDRQRGGISIGIRRDNLWNAIDRIPGGYSKVVKVEGEGMVDQWKNPAFLMQLLPCLYSETDKDVIDELFEFRGMTCRVAFERIGKAKYHNEVLPEDLVTAIMAIMEVSIVVKNEAFINEQEERLILFPKTSRLDDCELLGGKPRWRTYIGRTRKEGVGNPKYQALRGMFREIWISPHGERRVLMQNVRFLLDKYGMDFCAIKRSALPYNGR